MKIILASGSPRRRDLLKLIVPEFEIMISDEDEKLKENLSNEEQAIRLAYQKAKNVYEKTEGDRIVIGGDTIVVKDNKIYGKPKDEEDAKRIINELLKGDKTNEIITGLAILIEKEGKYNEYKTFDKVKVYLKNISDMEIEKWVKTGNAMDKAGAYSVQSEFGVFVEKIEGNCHSAIGFPIQKVYEVLKEYME